MPEEGIQLSPDRDILTSAEIVRLSALFVHQGVTKIRLTGGEPTVKKDIVPLMRQLGRLRKNGLQELAMTTNGISLHRKLDDMVAAGLTGVNISLDTLDPFQFQLLTRRQGFHAVMKSIDKVKEMNKTGAGIKLKINCVVMRGLNDHQIISFADLTKQDDIEVRFIEYMPFGGNRWSKNKMMSYSDIVGVIRAKYPDIRRRKDAKNDTSKTWQVPGFVGRLGFITSMTHNFCGNCNRLRITSDGNIKVCLHGQEEVSLRDILRKCNGGEPIEESDFEAVRQATSESALRAAEKTKPWIDTERELLQVIGAAVKGKKESHAGIGELENMQNRPMILIGG
jgi:cyclic pyranopterin phosphate synthase